MSGCYGSDPEDKYYESLIPDGGSGYGPPPEERLYKCTYCGEFVKDEGEFVCEKCEEKIENEKNNVD